MSLKIEDYFNEDLEQYIINPIGEIDMFTSESLKTRLVEIIEENSKNILIDCENLEFIDSTGLGALIHVLKVAQERDIEITIKNAKPNIKKLFFLTNLDKVFNIEE